MRFDSESTICAIATGSEGALRGAIRISGPKALAMAAEVCVGREPKHWQSTYAIRFQDEIELDRLGTIQVDIYLWPDHRSYTGQPSVEMHCIGNQVILNAIQMRLIEVGATLAQAGEFTLRAFLAGRLDLTQCEAVLGVIHAANDRSLNVALSQLAGGLTEPLKNLRTSLVNLLADIEAGLDFVDEDIEFISLEQITARLDQAKTWVAELLEQMESRSAQSVELQVAIVGAPNAGKSSLLNAMAQKQIAIVSAEPGTTRDYVRVRMEFEGVVVDLVDTAGVESTSDQSPRAMAQQVTQQQVHRADLILYCRAVDDIDSEEWKMGDAQSHETPVWLVHTKCDLIAPSRKTSSSYDREWMVSTFHLESIERLAEELHQWALEKSESVHHVVPMTAARCQTSLASAMRAIEQALHATESRIGDEIIASEIRLALEDIGMVAGTVYTDDILDALFSRFCIGK
jgi:tRNA modification GTPase